MAYDEDLAERVRAALSDAGVTTQEKPMFGGLAFLVAGSMAVAVSGRGGLMVRCEPAETATLLAGSGVGPMQMNGRDVDGWVRVAATEVGDDAAGGRALRRWVETGTAYAASLPPG